MVSSNCLIDVWHHDWVIIFINHACVEHRHVVPKGRSLHGSDIDKFIRRICHHTIIICSCICVTMASEDQRSSCGGQGNIFHASRHDCVVHTVGEVAKVCTCECDGRFITRATCLHELRTLDGLSIIVGLTCSGKVVHL